MTDRYAKNYRILGITPDTTWIQLRRAYKSLVNLWHPDRFQQDIHQRKLAEEKTKEITQSYQELAEYYKKFGVLPPIAKAPKIHDSDNISPPGAPAPPVHATQGTDASSTSVTPPQAHASRRSKPNARTITVIVLASIVYLVWQTIPWEHASDLPQNSETHPDQPADKQKNEGANHRTATDEKYFTFGTPLGEVYAIQGVPTKTDNDIWHYGSSKIYFAKGKVLRWEESSNNPLRVNIKSGSETMNAEFFGIGSSKREVLAVQGAPERDAGSVWDYGGSRVYFANERVKGWDESPFNPLRVRR